MDIEQKFREIVAEDLCVDPESVTKDAVFTEDLGADSLDMVKIMLSAETAFDIEIQDDEFEDSELTFGQAIEKLQKYLTPRAA